MASCGDPLFLCSCADCPVAPGCSIVSMLVLVVLPAIASAFLQPRLHVARPVCCTSQCDGCCWI
jgi:hypothetical protein